MTNLTSAAGTPAALPYPRWDSPVFEHDKRTLERERLEARARNTDASAQLLRCFPSWTRALEQLNTGALERLAASEPVDPNDLDAWRSRDAHAQAILHRHGKARVSATRLTSAAIAALIDGQGAAGQNAGVDWSVLTASAAVLDERLALAHARLPGDLDDPAVWAYQVDQRRVLAGRLGLGDRRADELWRWVLAEPGRFAPDDLRCWRIGSDTWLSLAGEQLDPVGKVERPGGAGAWVDDSALSQLVLIRELDAGRCVLLGSVYASPLDLFERVVLPRRDTYDRRESAQFVLAARRRVRLPRQASAGMDGQLARLLSRYEEPQGPGAAPGTMHKVFAGTFPFGWKL